MSRQNVLPIVSNELEERLAQYRHLISRKDQAGEDIRKTERRVALLKELLELEGVESEGLSLVK